MNLLDLFVKIGVDDQASGPVSKISSKIGAGLKTAAKIGVAAIGAVATAGVALGKQAMESYADFEQLTGGVETLFGKSAAIVREYADVAYETAGLSANAYMETVTSFSASLLQSLEGDTEAAANYADMAITDMSDNANKMGSTMQSIQNAYQGFAKQNYSMLDNLKLGYGGTATEMYRLLSDAAALNEEFANTANFSIDSKGHLEAGFADIVQAIHIVQEEMGITGTTAAEASQTLSGSVSAAKAAWENMLTAIASDDMDVGEYIDRFVESLVTAADNVIPRAEQILQGVSSLISGMAPVISTMLPQIINGFLPGLLSSAVELITNLLTNLVGILPGLLSEGMLPIALILVDSLLGMLPQIMEAAVQLVAMLAMGLAEAAPTLIPAAIDTVLQLCNALLSPESITLLLNAAVALLMGLAEGITTALPMIAEQAPVIISGLVNALLMNLPAIFTAAIEIIIALIGGLFSAFPTLIAGIWDICTGIVETIGKMDWKEIGLTLLETVGDGIFSAAANILESINKAFAPAIEWISVNLLGKAPGWGKDMIQGLINGIRSMIGKVKDAVKSVADTISKWLHFSRPDVGPLRDYEQWMPDMIDGMVKGIDANKYKLSNAVAGLASDMNANMTVTAKGIGSAAVSGGNNTFNFNIYGAEGQDVRELANIVMEHMQAAVSRKDAVFNK